MEGVWSMRENELTIIENFLENKEEKLDVKEEPFDKLMFFYQSALKQLELQMNIIKDEFKVMYNYDLIDHIDTRIKEPKSIVKKMEKKKYEKTYLNLIEKVNDIAGMRIICNSKKDIYTIKDLIKQMPELKVLEEKDYIKQKKESGYTAYHLIVETPVKVKETVILVKVEIQIRTELMDFWASAEHKIKYKTNKKLSYLDSKKMCIYAKKINQLEDRIMKIYQKQIEK